MTSILCIDDEEPIRLAIVEELKDAGYDVAEASNGKMGLEAAIAHKPDLVLCDISMPKMDGLELLSLFRKESSGLEDVPFIFLTSLNNRESMLTGLNDGADDYLTKPIDFDLLLAKVNASLRQVNRMLNKRQGEHIRLYKALSHTSTDEPKTDKEGGPTTSPSLSIVLVGRDEPILKKFKQMLESRGNSVRVYFSGIAFVDDMENIDSDIAMMSFYSDDMQALMTAKLARRANMVKDIPFVLIWSEDLKEFPLPSKFNSFNHVLELPATEAEIMELIEAWAVPQALATDPTVDVENG